MEDYGALAEALAPLRERGLRVADRRRRRRLLEPPARAAARARHREDGHQLTRGIDRDAGRRALASALISFAGEMDMTIVAEGIETAAELHALRELGVRYGQGFYLSQPAPLD